MFRVLRRKWLRDLLLTAALLAAPAALTAAVTRFFPLSEPVSSYLAEQAETIAGLDFTSALAISLATVFVVWTLWVLLCGMMVKKNGGKMPRHRL